MYSYCIMKPSFADSQFDFQPSYMTLSAASPFGPPGHFPQRGQHSPGTVAQATDARGVPSEILLCQPQMRSQPPPRNLALATDARGVPSGEAVASATEGATALTAGSARCKPLPSACPSHRSPAAVSLACRFPFRPFGPLSPKRTALTASDGCAWRPLWGSCRVATEGATALTAGSARCKPLPSACPSHRSPAAVSLACRFPFRPSGPLSPKGTAQKGPPKLLFGGPEALP